MLKRILHNAFHTLGFDVVRRRPDDAAAALPADLPAADRAIIEFVRPYTLTSTERLIALIDAVRYVADNRLPGAVAECGVWKGGSMMAVARTLLSLGDTSRELYLYDTFEGMSAPTDDDRSFDGRPAVEQLAETPRGEGVWCYSSLDEVKRNLFSTGYPPEKIHFIEGKIEETVPAHNPPPLALLRLDTDWYESTRHELAHLFPLLCREGVLIIDDYGHWQGARKAVDEFLAAQPRRYYLHRIDFTGRLLIK